MKSHPARRLTDVDVYPVGLLHDLRRLWMLRHAPRRERWRARYQLRRIATELRSGRRNYLNGYLAEPRLMDHTWKRCGHGWTRARALRDLDRHRQAVADHARATARATATAGVGS